MVLFAASCSIKFFKLNKMKLHDNKILITEGASGIGFALAGRFL